MSKNCLECSEHTVIFAPQVMELIYIRQGQYKAKRKPAGTSIEKTINEMIREWKTLTKSEPVVIINSNDEFEVMREVNENERLHIINALNKKVK